MLGINKMNQGHVLDSFYWIKKTDCPIETTGKNIKLLGDFS